MTENHVLENKIIVYQLEQEEYAVSVQHVGSIERVLPITRVPGAPKFVKGVVNLRGIVTPVIDLTKRFYNKDTEFTEQTRIIIVNIEDITVGLIVDSANDVIDIRPEQIEPAPDAIGSRVVDYISGVIKLDNRLFILLDLQKVLNKAEINDVKAMEG